MNFNNAKENIQPLEYGRNANRLATAKNVELNDAAQKKLQLQKCEYEEKIQNYVGDDPLEIWFEYISWVEHYFDNPKSEKGYSMNNLLKKCLLQFGNNSKYFQDPRFVKIYIKFIDTHKNPIEIYEQLYNQGIGTMVADFYISWVYYYDLLNNFNKANEIFIKGIDARAQPLEELEQAQKALILSIPARLLNRDEVEKQKFLSTMEEKRKNLTSLKAHKYKYVGSVHTGNVNKSFNPGMLASSSTTKNIDTRTDASITHSITDKACDTENNKDLGRWSKAIQNVNSINEGLAFPIMENNANHNLDEELAIKLPSNFKRLNRPQSEYKVPLFISEEKPFCLPRYDKMMVYPGNGEEYSLEELRAWKYFKKLNVKNLLVLKYDKFWTNEALKLNVRFRPCFPNRNQKQSEFLTDPPPNVLPNNQRIHVCVWKNYDYSEDLTIEDLLAEKWWAHLKNKTVVMNMSLDETAICNDNNSVIMIDESNLLNDNQRKADEPYFQSKIETKTTNFETANESKHVFEIFTDENIAVKQDIPNKESPIFVDNTESAKIQSINIFEDDNQHVFKDPQYTGTIKKYSGSPQPLQETQFESKENEIDGCSTEETFSTQNFVLFIKQQETSTPLQNKRRELNILLSKENEKTENTPKLPIISSENVSLPESDVIPKQLSVIMETSETNTGSSCGTSIKSSVEENESPKPCNHTAKFKTINNGQNLSTIHETSCPREPSETEISKFTTLGLSNLKLIGDSVIYSNNLSTKELCCVADELCELKTPDCNINASIEFKSSPLKSIPPKSTIFDNSEEELWDFFQKSPKTYKNQFIPAAPVVLNNSVTIPSFKEILLNNKCDNSATTKVTTTIMGASMALPDNQSIVPEFTENITIFGQHHKSQRVSFTKTKLNEDNSDLIRFSTKISESEGNLGKSIIESKIMIGDEDNFDDEESGNEQNFQPKIIDLDQTRQLIDDCVSTENIDPWNIDLCYAFLEDLDFFNYLEKRDDCMLINNVPSLKGEKNVEIAGKLINSVEYISKGAYGFIYRGKDVKSDKMVVLKQERPPNCWEYYISIIITERIFLEFLPRFLVIDNALIGNNSSIFVSDYVKYGTLLDICNKMYASTSRHLNEFIVMVLAIELFTIIDLLHSADIIHGDIKPANFLLTAPLSLDSSRPILKLIDYGNSIDMQRFPSNTTFKTVIKNKDFICSEMQDGRSWTYQTDLYCLAETIHILLFGHYMKTENKLGKINILTKLSRHSQKAVWESIFISLLNVPDCRTFPNLQDFKLDLKVILADKETLVLEKISSFNRIIL